MPRSRSGRNAQLAKIPLGIAGRAAVGYGRRLIGGDRAEINAELTRRAAEQLFAILGELKGGAMKVGQVLSVLEAAAPEEFAAPFRESLTKLQAEAPPMPTAQVHRMLAQQLGSGWRTRFRSFDDKPSASASIGQVHRAVWSDGRDVAVKIQYPGADEALRADLRTLSRLSSLIGRLVPGADVKSIITELTDRAEEELDYRIEAANQRVFAKAFDVHPYFVIPKVVASAPKVVVTEWVTAVRLSTIIAEGTTEQRNLAAARMAEFHVSAPALAGMLHGDPHPGNFMLLPDDRFCVIDYGACSSLPDGFPKPLGQMLRLAHEAKFAELVALMHEHNFIRAGHELSAEEIVGSLRPITDPMSSELFHFSRKWVRRALGPSTDFTSKQFQTNRTLNLPAEYVVILRVLIGSLGIYGQLDAEFGYLKILSEWLPGFADSTVESND